MGSSFSTDDEGPSHTVIINSFFMAKTEITQKQWEDVMDYNNSHFKGENRPIESVSWYEAIKFCNTLSIKHGLEPVYYINSKMTEMNMEANGYRLPTEAEWEYAAIGGVLALPTVFAGSNRQNNVTHKNATETSPVATKIPNELGLYDMTGNVAEWTWDWYDIATYGIRDLTKQNIDPTGPVFGDYKSLRGGSWLSLKKAQKLKFRSYHYPDKKLHNAGFRIVRRK